MKEEKKSLIYDLKRYKNKTVFVKFIGGREIIGRLVGYDNIPNLVLKKQKNSESDWAYGDTVVCLGPSIISISLGAPFSYQ